MTSEASGNISQNYLSKFSVYFKECIDFTLSDIVLKLDKASYKIRPNVKQSAH